MPNFAANLSFLWSERDFLDRFECAAEAGFRAVEYLFPYKWDGDLLRQRLHETGLKQALFNAPPGHWDKGERGFASLTGREDEFRESLHLVQQYAEKLDCSHVHVMAGLSDPALTPEAQLDQFKRALEFALEETDGSGLTLLIEPINTDDIPGYFLNSFAMALELVQTFNTDRLRLQFDFYHCQKIHGNVTKWLQKCVPYIAHMQIANPPDRHEPSCGELNFPYLFEQVDRSSYSGWIGCEYIPSTKTDDSFDWFQPYIKRQPVMGVKRI